MVAYTVMAYTMVAYTMAAYTMVAYTIDILIFKQIYPVLLALKLA